MRFFIFILVVLTAARHQEAAPASEVTSLKTNVTKDGPKEGQEVSKHEEEPVPKIFRHRGIIQVKKARNYKPAEGYSQYTGIQYSPLELAEYVFRTKDEEGVAVAVEELVLEGLMGRADAINYLQDVKQNLEYLKQRFEEEKQVQRGANFQSHYSQKFPSVPHAAFAPNMKRERHEAAFEAPQHPVPASEANKHLVSAAEVRGHPVLASGFKNRLVLSSESKGRVPVSETNEHHAISSEAKELHGPPASETKEHHVTASETEERHVPSSETKVHHAPASEAKEHLVSASEAQGHLVSAKEHPVPPSEAMEHPVPAFEANTEQIVSGRVGTGMDLPGQKETLDPNSAGVENGLVVFYLVALEFFTNSMVKDDHEAELAVERIVESLENEEENQNITPEFRKMVLSSVLSAIEASLKKMEELRPGYQPSNFDKSKLYRMVVKSLMKSN